jgi:hypothetical protein
VSKDLLILEDDLHATRIVYPATRRPVPADVITSRVESYDWLVVTLMSIRVRIWSWVF